MSTNSRIGILIPSTDPTYSDDSVLIRSIYCHWDGYPSHMGKVLHQHYGRKDLVNELLDKGDARLLNIDDGSSEHYMHSEGGHDAYIMTLNHFTKHFLEEYNYIAVPIESDYNNSIEWVVCEPVEDPRLTVQFKLVVDEIINETGTFPQLSTKEKQILYMDLNRIERINPSVIGTIYQACVQSLHNATDLRMQNV